MRRAAAFALITLLVLPARADTLDGQGARFAQLALALGRIDPKAVDASFGPPITAPRLSMGQVLEQAQQLAAALRREPPSARRDRLLRKVDSLTALAGGMKTPLSFEEEARRIYGMMVPPPDPRGQARARAALEKLLPGKGELSARLAAWRARFAIPPDRRKAVFGRALAECRSRTQAHWPLPSGETIEIAWSSDVPAAWHRYLGQGRSHLTINPEAVAEPGTALDVACHEGYPGHHAQFLALTARGVLPEDGVVLLHSPGQVLREGAANYGVDLALPMAARLAFMRDVLFPLAGLPKREAARYEQVHRLAGILALSVLPILRDYHDGRLASGDAMVALMLQGAVTSPQALMEFTRTHGAYVVGYTAARDWVAACVAVRAKATGQDAWAVLRTILAEADTAMACASK